MGTTRRSTHQLLDGLLQLAQILLAPLPLQRLCLCFLVYGLVPVCEAAFCAAGCHLVAGLAQIQTGRVRCAEPMI
jgi:hypothetical protein